MERPLAVQPLQTIIGLESRVARSNLRIGSAPSSTEGADAILRRFLATRGSRPILI